MILVDTSVWVDHLRKGEPDLARLLNGGEVLIHAYVVGELALGRLQRRAVLQDLQRLPQAPVASPAEVLGYIESVSLFGMGIGYVDAHLLSATALSPFTKLWTRDKRLRTASQELGLCASLA